VENGPSSLARSETSVDWASAVGIFVESKVFDMLFIALIPTGSDHQRPLKTREASISSSGQNAFPPQQLHLNRLLGLRMKTRSLGRAQHAKVLGEGRRWIGRARVCAYQMEI